MKGRRISDQSFMFGYPNELSENVVPKNIEIVNQWPARVSILEKSQDFFWNFTSRSQVILISLSLLDLDFQTFLFHFHFSKRVVGKQISPFFSRKISRFGGVFHSVPYTMGVWRDKNRCRRQSVKIMIKLISAIDAIPPLIDIYTRCDDDGQEDWLDLGILRTIWQCEGKPKVLKIN